MEEFGAAVEAMLAAERSLSRARGEPTCVVIDWQPAWDVGAPCPHVVSTGHRTFLVYLVAEASLPCDGTTVRVVDPSSGDRDVLALVEPIGCYAHRFGGPNDELIAGHPFHGRGLHGYRAHVVENSPWIAVERATNSVHRGFREERWARTKHYLLSFHDDTFECLAEGWTIEIVAGTFRQVVEVAVDRVFAGERP